jgi:hypothetical protein
MLRHIFTSGCCQLPTCTQPHTRTWVLFGEPACQVGQRLRQLLGVHQVGHCVNDGVNVLNLGQQRLYLQQKVCAVTGNGGLKSVAVGTGECSTSLMMSAMLFAWGSSGSCINLFMQLLWAHQVGHCVNDGVNVLYLGQQRLHLQQTV